MKLYHSPTSPYVRKVMVILHETGLLDQVTLETVAGTPLEPAPELLARNPLTKIPALELTGGEILFDSRVICAWFDDRAGAGLYGQGRDMWRLRTLEALADGILDAALLMTYEARLREPGQRSAAWVEGQWAKIGRAIGALNGRWMDLLDVPPGAPLNIGQIAVACALGYVDFRHGVRNWRAGNDRLAAWHDGFVERPSLQATRPPAA